MYIHVYMFVSEILLAYLNNTSHIHSIEKRRLLICML